jgi:hypothetical protein
MDGKSIKSKTTAWKESALDQARRIDGASAEIYVETYPETGCGHMDQRCGPVGDRKKY